MDAMNRNTKRKKNYQQLRDAGFDSFDALAFRDLSDERIARLCDYMKNVKHVMREEIERIVRGDPEDRTISRLRS